MISKLKKIIGHRDPHHSDQEGKSNELLRVMYGQNRFDNAFFLSESVREAIVEIKSLSV